MQLENGFLVEERYSAWQRRKVRTIIVSAHAKTAAQRSITAALTIAKPYDRIELTDGEYPEAVTLSFPVEIAAAEGEEPLIVSRNSGITITSRIDVYLENLNVISRSSSGRTDGALVVMAGTPIAKKCTLSSVVVGGSAQPSLEDCTITGSTGGYGMLYQDAGGGRVKDCVVRAHKKSCVEVDTRGELHFLSCTLSNAGADVVVITASNSSIPTAGAGPDSQLQLLRCSGVSFTECRFSVDEASAGVALDAIVPNAAGCPCCMTIANGAAPTCETNEFSEGEVGILLDAAGPAKLRGNSIRCQRRCGILALVEEGFAYLDGYESLKISGDNVLDRCLVGIDVQCRRSSKETAAVPDAKLAAAPMPPPKRAFRWLSGLEQARQPTSASVGASEEDSKPFLYLGDLTSHTAVEKALTALALSVLQAHPTCLQPVFTMAAGSNTSSLLPGPVDLGTGASGPVVDALRALLKADTRVLAPFLSSAAVRNEKEYLSLLELRGNRGIDIVNTRFSSCTMCAVRFGRQSCGLLEACSFEDCGTHAVMVDSGAHPVITGCRILRCHGAGIVLNGYAHPLIIGNEVASGKVNGIDVNAMSRGVIVANLLTGNQGAAVAIAQMSTPLLCANLINQNRTGGVSISGVSQPVLLRNSFSGNLIGQLVCTEESDPVVMHNIVQATVDAGMLFTNCSRGTVHANDISHNGDGIVVQLDADPYVSGNTIHENERSGVTASNNALGTFVQNTITGNHGPNVLVTEGADPHFRDNSIERSSSGGIVVASEGLGSFDRNQVSENAVGNVIVVDMHSEPLFTGNNICASTSGCGVICGKGAGGLFMKNRVHENRQCGVYVFEGAAPQFTDNRVSREPVGVLVTDGGKGHFSGNVVENCFGSGIISQREAEPYCVKNIIQGNNMNGVLIAPDGLGKFLDNTVTENDVGVQFGSSLHTASLNLQSVYVNTSTAARGAAGHAPSADNSLQQLARKDGSSETDVSPKPNTEKRRRSSYFSDDPEKSALREFTLQADKRRASVARAVACQVNKNRITLNKNGGILLDYGCNGIVEENEIAENHQFGVRANVLYASQRAQAAMESPHEQLLVGSTGGGAAGMQTGQTSTRTSLKPVGCATLRKNRVLKHVVANIAFEHFDPSAGNVSLEENDVSVAPIGLLVTSGSVVSQAQRNEVHDCLDGMYFEDGGKGYFSENRIANCRYCGVYVCDRGEPVFTEKNVVEMCGICGVLVDAGGSGSFENGTMRRCLLAGVLVFAGPTTPFHVPYDEALQAAITTATPTFSGNCIEENTKHGVLVLSVISGAPLRTPRHQARVFMSAGKQYFPAVTSPGESPLVRGSGATHVAKGERLCACFTHNTIQRNKLFGVFHDRFEHWDMDMIFHVKTDSPLAPGKPIGKRQDSSANAASSKANTTRAQPPSTSPDRGMKNAYGGYEILLGTSQIGSGDDHLRKRELKQVTFKDNLVCRCSVGVAVGYGCHPFLLRNKIKDNLFIGLLLRFGSAAMAHDCEVSHNGLMGVYAASGAKGFISNGEISRNNALCRPEGRPHEPRNLAKTVNELGAAWPESSGAADVHDVAEIITTAGVPLTEAERCMEQLTQLEVVHAYTLPDSVKRLWELACASSAAMSLASGCVPSSLFTQAETGAREQPSASVRRTTGAAASEQLGGLAVSELVQMCNSDGGLGVWIEEASRVTVSENRIEGNHHAGVYFGTGLLKQHRILHRWFSVSGDSNYGPGGAGKDGRAGTLAVVHAVPGRAGKQSLLSTNSTAVNGSGYGEGGASSFEALFSLSRERPALATQHSAALFTSHALCASDVMAAATVKDLAGRAVASELLSEGSFTSMPTATSFVLDAEPPGKQSSDYVEDKRQRIDSIHCATIVENRIVGNEGFGIFLEISQSMAAQSDKSPTAAGTPKVSSFAMPLDEPSPRALVEDLSQPDVAIVDSDDNMGGGLDFSVVVDANSVQNNKLCGIHCQQVVDVHAGAFIFSRGTLSDAVQKQYETVRAALVLRDGNAAALSNELSLPFRVLPVRQKISNAYIVDNELSGNGGRQGVITSRYVVTTGDGEKSLLQCDTLADLPTSRFSSLVLSCIPLYAALVARPPPGLCLWDRNRIRDSKNGLRVYGILGSSSLRFQRNRMERILGEAVVVEGHLTTGTIGARNVFENCQVSVRVDVDTARGRFCGPRITIPGTADAYDCRTRVFGNTFRASTQSSFVVDGATGDSILLYNNEFTEHALGSVGVLLTDEATGGVLVKGNTFRHSYSPLVMTTFYGSGGGGAASLSASLRRHSSRRATARACVTSLLVGNLFAKNFIGALICNGASPRLEYNLFEANLYTGVEVIGQGTKPVIETCVFRNHCRPVDSTNDDRSVSDAVRRLSNAALPADGRLSLLDGLLSIELVPGNTRVLSPNSQICLPSGAVIGPYVECHLSRCYFVENDIGVDVARDAVASSLTLASSVMNVQHCLFQKHCVAGVLVRSQETDSSCAVESSRKTGESKTQSYSAEGKTSGQEAGTLAATDASQLPQTTVFDSCFFVANAATGESTGDVVNTRGGSATFRHSLFYGTVHAKRDGHCFFVSNTFLCSDAAGDSGTEEGGPSSGAGASRGALVEATADATLAAVMLHDGATACFEDNTIAFRRRGVLAHPDANGHVRLNRVVCCATAITVSPYCHSTIAENRVLESSDCGVLAFGGLVTGNEIYNAPAGIVLQPASQFRGYNAIPSHKRIAGDHPLCCRNTVALCAGDGILVASDSKVDGNVVFRCQTGLNIVCPATMEAVAAAAGIAGITAPPRVTSNTVFDCHLGVLMDDHSASLVQDNDVFDNESVGVVVVGTAAGTLQGNRISSNTETGAVEIPPDCRVKTNGNVIRNQFSPAYNRTTRANRAKEHQEKRDLVRREVDTVRESVADLSSEGGDVVTSMVAATKSILEQLASLARQNSVDVEGSVASPSRIRLRRSLREALSGLAQAADEDAMGDSSPALSTFTAASSPGARARVASESRNTNRTSAQRSSSATSRRGSQTAVAARKNAAAAAARAARPAASGAYSSTFSGGARTPVPPASTAEKAKSVIIHVLTKLTAPNAHSTALALGEAVARVLASPPMSKMTLTTTITTSSAQLTSTLQPAKGGPLHPFLVILVVDATLEVLPYGARHVLSLLHAAAKPKLENGATESVAPSSSFVYLLHPASLPVTRTISTHRNSNSLTSAETEGLAEMELSTFAEESNGVFSYRTGVEDILGLLKETMAEQISEASTRFGRRRVSVSSHSTKRKASVVSVAPFADADHPLEPSSPSEYSNKVSPVRSPTLSREKIGRLFSLITPEALGYNVAPSDAPKKRRKSSVTSGKSANKQRRRSSTTLSNSRSGTPLPGPPDGESKNPRNGMTNPGADKPSVAAAKRTTTGASSKPASRSRSNSVAKRPSSRKGSVSSVNAKQ